MTFWGNKQGFCDGVNRRSFLQLGVAGMAAVGMPELLRAKEASRQVLRSFRKSAPRALGEVTAKSSSRASRCVKARRTMGPLWPAEPRKIRAFGLEIGSRT